MKYFWLIEKIKFFSFIPSCFYISSNKIDLNTINSAACITSHHRPLDFQCSTRAKKKAWENTKLYSSVLAGNCKNSLSSMFDCKV